MSEKSVNYLIVLWQIAVMAMLAWTAFEVPLSFGLNADFAGMRLVGGIVASLICIGDIAILLYSRKIVSASTHSHINLKMGGMAQGIDVVSTIPFEMFLLLPSLAPLAMLRLIRFGKIFKVGRIFAQFETILLKLRFVRITAIVFATLSIIHWVACIWAALRPPPDPAGSALDAYITALYWTVTTLATVGYGDIVPTTPVTKVFAIGVMFLGVAFFASILGIISRIIASAQKHKEENKQKLNDLTLFMEHYAIPWHLQNHVYAYHMHVANQRLSGNDEQIISELPKSLQSDLRTYMKVRLISDIAIFSGASIDCLKEIAGFLKQVSFGPDDKIIAKGEMGQEVFIINHGLIRITNDANETIATLKRGQCVGESALISQSERNANVYAVTYCDIYTLDKDAFQILMTKHPQLRDQFIAVMKERAHA